MVSRRCLVTFAPVAGLVVLSRQCLVTFAPAAGLLSSGVLGRFTEQSGMWPSCYRRACAAHAQQSRAQEVTEWLLCSVGSQSRHQKHRPLCQLPLNNSAWVFLGTGRQLLPRPRQTLVLPPVVSLSGVLHLWGRFKMLPCSFRALLGSLLFPGWWPSQPSTFPTLKPSQLQPPDPPLSRVPVLFSMHLFLLLWSPVCPVFLSEA